MLQLSAFPQAMYLGEMGDLRGLSEEEAHSSEGKGDHCAALVLGGRTGSLSIAGTEGARLSTHGDGSLL